MLNDEVARAALAGLRAHPKTLPPKLLYDAEGVRLFNLITEQPEYTLTRMERGLLARHGAEMAAAAPEGAALVEYGASDETKALALIEAAPGRFGCYVPVDVQPASLTGIVSRLAASHPGLVTSPVTADFGVSFALPGEGGAPRFGFFPGSTIGNFEPDAAVAFLRRARATLGRGAPLLIGTDLPKPEPVLLAAYDDAAGVTAAFNLNLLVRLNREAAADFTPSRFRHRAVWNAAESRIEMHLVSAQAQDVSLAGTRIAFAAGETIHTESSYKYARARFAGLAQDAGWSVARVWEADGFALQLLLQNDASPA